ncbi:rhomboid family intramembrane serine protease [Ferrimonas pelagia]|uniref:Peptidase S54 rhomboid domain-containing protein n=1 Tax=Ferrimonas pelagia TaxID=1177826 RepID=A0ABP9FHS7_9GAMM
MKAIKQQLFSLKQSIKLTAVFVLLLWVIWGLEWLLDGQLFRYGIVPREVGALWGIVWAPFIHGSAAHLAANSTGLLILGSALLFGYPRSRSKVLLLIWLVSGVGVWLAGRTSYHFGASGLTYGLFFFLFIVSLLRRDPRSIALMMVAFFMFGGMIYGIFPRDPGVSFESHLFGAVGGVLAAIWFWRDDPLPRRKRYDWEGEKEGEGEAAEEDKVGDLWQAASAPEQPRYDVTESDDRSKPSQ